MRRLRVPWGGVSALAYLPDGRLVTGDTTGAVHAWDPAAGRGEFLFSVGQRAPDNFIRTFFVSPCGRWLACRPGQDRTVRDLVAGWDVPVFRGYKSVPTAVAFLPGGELAAYVHTASGFELRAFDLTGGSHPRRYAARPLAPAALSPDGRFVVEFDYFRYEHLTVWEASSGAVVVRLPKPAAPVERVLISADAERVCVAGRHVAAVYAVPSGDKLAEAEPTAIPRLHHLTHAELTPDGRCLVLAGAGPAVALWDIAADRPRATFDAELWRVDALAVSPDGLTVAAGGHSGVTVLDLD